MISALRIFFKDIKISHSVFALPFAMSAFTFFGFSFVRDFPPSFFVAIIVCIVAARTFAMGMNRYLDAEIDAENTRTRQRSLPAGKIAKKSVLGISLGAGFIFICCSFFISSLCGMLSFLVLLIIGAYPMMKKLTYFTHYYLGFCLGIAPLGVAVSLTGSLHIPVGVYFVSFAVMLWTGGFDILYALQDIDFDLTKKLHSVPARFGVATAIKISQLSFFLMIISLATAGFVADKGVVYFFGTSLVAAILFIEHYLIRDAKNSNGHSKNINLAFFNLNAFCSVFFFVFCVIDLYL